MRSNNKKKFLEVFWHPLQHPTPFVALGASTNVLSVLDLSTWPPLKLKSGYALEFNVCNWEGRSSRVIEVVEANGLFSADFRQQRSPHCLIDAFVEISWNVRTLSLSITKLFNYTFTYTRSSIWQIRFITKWGQQKSPIVFIYFRFLWRSQNDVMCPARRKTQYAHSLNPVLRTRQLSFIKF